MFATRQSRRLAGAAAAVFVVGLVTVVGLWWVFRDYGAKQITAYFTETIGVYPGSDLRVLGVKVGTIDSVLPEGGQVKVVMTLDHDVSAPANAQAVVVSPSVVSDRYIQLTPAYTGGPQLANNAVIPADRTATPVELDQLYQSLNQLAGELGPNGANRNGALSDLLNTAAANLNGNGTAFGTMIDQLGAATRTLSGSKDDLFDTINNLQQFTTMLKNNDSQVRTATQQLAGVSGFLAADRQDLGSALNELATALGQVQTFIQDNRDHIKSNVDKLAAISQILVNQRASLSEALDDMPLAVTNLLNSYDPATHTLDSRGDLLEIAPQSSKPDSAQSTTLSGSLICPDLGSACAPSTPSDPSGPPLPMVGGDQ